MGAKVSGRWHTWHRFCRRGATSFVNVTCGLLPGEVSAAVASIAIVASVAIAVTATDIERTALIVPPPLFHVLAALILLVAERGVKPVWRPERAAAAPACNPWQTPHMCGLHQP